MELRRVGLKQLVNELIREGLRAQQTGGAQPTAPFSVVAHQGGFAAAVDVAQLNRLADELEVDDFLHEVARAR